MVSGQTSDYLLETTGKTIGALVGSLFSVETVGWSCGGESKDLALIFSYYGFVIAG